MPCYPSTQVLPLQVTTEGDAFILAFHDPLDAVGWALHTQLALLEAPWPADIFQHPLAKVVNGSDGKLLFRGPRVRMAIHTGIPDEIIVRPAPPAVFSLLLRLSMHTVYSYAEGEQH